MQYTASSFADGIVRMFAWALWPKNDVRPPAAGAFPKTALFARHVPDPVLDRLVLPVVRGLAWLTLQARLVQRGPYHIAFLYILAAIIILFLAF